MSKMDPAGQSPPVSRLNIEKHSIDYIPESERHAKLHSQGPFWFLGNFHLLTLSMGFVGPEMGLSAVWTFFAGTSGIMIGTLFMAFHGSQGPEMGLPQMIQSRAQFGYRGVVLILIATLFVFIGFNVVNISLIMGGLHRVLGLNPIAVACVATLAGGIMAIFGHDLLHRVFKWALFLSVPLYLLVVIMLVLGVRDTSGATPVPLTFGWVPFLTLFALGASFNITYAIYVSDYTRYLPTRTRRLKLIGVIFLGASLSGAWMIGLGAWLAQQLGVSDALVAINEVGEAIFPGCGHFLVMIAVVGFLPVIALNTYSAMLTLLTGVDSFYPLRISRHIRIATIALISCLFLAAIISLSHSSGLTLLNAFMVLFLYFLVPWTSVNLVDYFFVRRGQYAITHFFTPAGIYGSWQFRGLAAYFIGFITMIPFFNIVDTTSGKPIFVGYFADWFNGIDVAWLVGLAVSALVYLRLSRSLDLQAEAKVIAQQADVKAETE